MRPQLRQLPVADEPDMDPGELQRNALTLGAGVDEPNDVLVTGENIVDLGSGRSPPESSAS